jgi:hypothetical protein
MHSIATFIAAAAFSLHVLLGCCWHHAHEREPHAKELLAATHDHSHAGCHHDHDADEGDHPEVCRAPQCVYTHTGTVTFLIDQPVAALPAMESVALEPQGVWPAVARWDDRGKLALGVPLFLAFEHLLN